MSTIFIPRNKKIEEYGANIAVAYLLREIIGTYNISGVGYGDYTTATEARLYSRKILEYLKENPQHEDRAYLEKAALFFKNCKGFWQK